MWWRDYDDDDDDDDVLWIVAYYLWMYFCICSLGSRLNIGYDVVVWVVQICS